MRRVYQYYFFGIVFFAPFFLVAMEQAASLPLVVALLQPLDPALDKQEALISSPRSAANERDTFLQQIAQQIAARKHQQEMAHLFPPANQSDGQVVSLYPVSLACISDWLRDKELFGD